MTKTEGNVIYILFVYNRLILEPKGLEFDTTEINILEETYRNSDIPIISHRKHIAEIQKMSTLIFRMIRYHADRDELEKAVEHALIVIDSTKHNLDYKKSEEDHGIKELMDKYGKDK